MATSRSTTLDDISLPRIVESLEEYLAPLRQKAVTQAREYVEAEAPQYRSILKAKRDAVEALPPDLGKEKLDVELRRIRYKHEEELRAKAAELLQKEGAADERAYEELLAETNAAAIDDLAKYVRSRRVILNLLRKAVRPTESGKFPLEEAIHRLVLPMRTTSDDIPYEQMNLWLIDERLAFHSYLASDKPLSSQEAVTTGSSSRPDVIVFNRPFAFSEYPAPAFQSVVIVEFKRPMRGEYDEKENPVAQVYDYVREVRAGRRQQRDGRPLIVPQSMPFYCYIVCDLTEKLRVFAENAGFRLAWDGQGYFGYNPERHAYVEVISFDKLIDDAEKRNRIFFEKLGLPKP